MLKSARRRNQRHELLLALLDKPLRPLLPIAHRIRPSSIRIAELIQRGMQNKNQNV